MTEIQGAMWPRVPTLRLLRSIQAQRCASRGLQCRHLAQVASTLRSPLRLIAENVVIIREIA